MQGWLGSMVVALRLAVLGVGAAALSGCGSVVYKETAASYVSAGRAVTKNLADSSLALAQARDAQKAERIVSDPKCPIASPRLFLRSSAATGEFVIAARSTPGADASPDCKVLAACLGDPAAPACAGACYSAAEGNCIAFLDDESARLVKGAMADDTAAGAARALRGRIAEAEYGRATGTASELIRTQLAALTEYLDLLSKVAAPRKPQPASEAQALADRLKNANDRVKNLTGATLSDADQARQAALTGTLAGAEKLIDDLRQMARNADDAAAVRRIVAERSADIDGLIGSVQELAVGDAVLIAATTDLVRLKARLSLQSRYALETDPRQRALLLEERARLPYANKAQMEQAVTALFDALRNSHAALVRLVLDPSQQDRQAIAEAAFREFKTIAADVASLVAIFN